MNVPAPASKLSNGATVIASHPVGHRDEVAVLAIYDGAQPYVTWMAYQSNGEWVCHSGHYWDDILDAVIDYSDRAPSLLLPERILAP